MSKKEEKKDKKSIKTSLLNFKIKYNIDEMNYAGMKHLLNAEDKDIKTEKECLDALLKFEELPAFIN